MLYFEHIDNKLYVYAENGPQCFSRQRQDTPPLDPWSSRPHLKHNKKEEFQGQLVILLSVNFNIRHKKFLKHNLN